MCAVAVCSARRGCFLRGMMCVNALETAGRAGEGQGGISSNQTLGDRGGDALMGRPGVKSRLVNWVLMVDIS